MEERNSNELADNLLKRAYKSRISIAELCRVGGVSRGWFERFKKHPPKSVEAYVKMTQVLSDRENGISGLAK